MKRSINFSKGNLEVQWQYVNTNLKEPGLWKEVEKRVKKAIKGTLERINRELRRVTRTVSCFQSQRSLDVFTPLEIRYRRRLRVVFGNRALTGLIGGHCRLAAG